MKQDISEMLPVLNKVRTLRVSIKKFTVALYLRHSNVSTKAQTWQISDEDVPKQIIEEDVPQVYWEHSTAQISVAGKISICICRMAKF